MNGSQAFAPGYLSRTRCRMRSFSLLVRHLELPPSKWLKNVNSNNVRQRHGSILCILRTVCWPSSLYPTFIWLLRCRSGATREFTGSIYVHAFQTASATREHVSKFDMDLSIQWWTIAGSQYDFSDPDFLANRITEENGCEVSQLSPVRQNHSLEFPS